ncbi:MAG: 2,3-bisphosphoglycerate-independent phosphoglycerate mutase [Candidatus Harrisonbacteria bacterium]|nr:2,3-bisphosphoglycerate-independent phosphoglycerate mutase [Candidatus Harrisonbacteria bacterium]
MLKPVVLLILDGLGISPETRGNAIHLAKKPNLKKVGENYLGCELQSSGTAAGIPWGEVGSSEVGHTNIGAGVVVYQNFPRINLAIQDGSFYKIPIWDEAIKRPRVHLIGLVTNSGIHAHIDHLLALIKMLARKKYKGEVFIHAFTDGEDAPNRSAPVFIKTVESEIAASKLKAQIATITGRHMAMDRSNKWERTDATIDCMTKGSGEIAKSPEKALENAYVRNIEDEAIPPTVIVGKNERPVGLLQKGDTAIFFNFRPDRARQLTERLQKLEGVFLITMTQFSENFTAPVAFPPAYIENPLAKVISDAGKKQFHIAEGEKSAHATYFLNGGKEAPFPGEDRVVIPSQEVESYAQKPEMSAYQITEKIMEAIKSNKYDFIAANFANADMVGHTGNLEAAIKAVEVLDECVGKIAGSTLAAGGVMTITADHGNAEEMINLETGKTDTEHSTNPVPFWIVGKNYLATNLPAQGSGEEPAGILADVAPTILEIMEIPKPKGMTGKSLIGAITRLVI